MNPVSIVALCVSGAMLLFAILTFGRNAKNDRKKAVTSSEAKVDGIKEGLLKANMKLDQLCAITTETRTDIKKMDNDIREMDRRVTIVERDLKTAFVRIDEIKEGQNEKS